MLIRNYFKNLSREEEAFIQDYLVKKLESIQPLLKAHYPNEDTLKLEAHAQRFEKHQAYAFELCLKLPERANVIAKEVKHHLPEVMDLAIGRLHRGIKKSFDRKGFDRKTEI